MKVYQRERLPVAIRYCASCYDRHVTVRPEYEEPFDLLKQCTNDACRVLYCPTCLQTNMRDLSSTPKRCNTCEKKMTTITTCPCCARYVHPTCIPPLRSSGNIRICSLCLVGVGNNTMKSLRCCICDQSAVCNKNPALHELHDSDRVCCGYCPSCEYPFCHNCIESQSVKAHYESCVLFDPPASYLAALQQKQTTNKKPLKRKREQLYDDDEKDDAKEEDDEETEDEKEEEVDTEADTEDEAPEIKKEEKVARYVTMPDSRCTTLPEVNVKLESM